MKLALAALIMLAIVPFTYAQAEKLEITAQIQPDLSVQHTLKYYFLEPLNNSVNYTLSSANRNIAISDGANSLEYRKDGDNIQIFLKQPTNILTIKYTAVNVIYKSDSSYFFTEFNFEEMIRQLDVTVSLPPGDAIYDNFFIPTGGQVITDGKNIMVSWAEPNALGTYMYSINFTNPNEQNSPLVLAALGIIIVAGYGVMRARRKIQESFLKGFRDDEKKTIEFLKQERTALQSDLQKKFGFSRAKATRIVSVLEKKSLLKKQKYGRTNKLTWK